VQCRSRRTFAPRRHIYYALTAAVAAAFTNIISGGPTR
jgi:hypothetical protein